MRSWLSVSFRRDVVVRSLKVAGIVGTLLTAINQGNVILAGQIGLPEILKIALTFCVPYCVSTYATVSAIMASSDAPV